MDMVSDFAAGVMKGLDDMLKLIIPPPSERQYLNPNNLIFIFEKNYSPGDI